MSRKSTKRTVERGISFQEVQDGHYLGQNSPKPVGKAEDDKIDDAMMDNKDTAQGINLLEPPKDLKGGGNGSVRGCREGGRGSGHHHTGSRSNVFHNYYSTAQQTPAQACKCILQVVVNELCLPATCQSGGSISTD